MSLSPYTTPDEVRAVLGVSDEELEDVTLNLALYETGLLEDLYEIDPSVVSTYQDLYSLPTESLTDIQRRFVNLTQLFATYSVAKQAGAGLPLFAPKSIADGKASFSRHADSPHKETLQRVEELFNLNRDRLASAYSSLVSASPTRTQTPYLVVSLPSANPVTGEGLE